MLVTKPLDKPLESIEKDSMYFSAIYIIVVLFLVSKEPFVLHFYIHLKFMPYDHWKHEQISRVRKTPLALQSNAILRTKSENVCVGKPT